MPPPRYVAFLRAVNVGGRVVKMAALKATFERAGVEDVSTFIASGNVLFRSAARRRLLEADLEAALAASLGFPVVTMVRTARAVAAVADYEPFAPATLEEGTLYIGFLRARPTAAAIRAALALQTSVDSLHVHGDEIYWLARQNLARATVTGARLEKALQTPMTLRNRNTVRRLSALAGA